MGLLLGTAGKAEALQLSRIDINPGKFASSPSGLRVFADLNPGSEASYPGSFTVFNNALYFNADDGVHGTELWKLEPDVATSVPEPTSGLGLLTFGAIGAIPRLKRKQKKPLNSVS
jgi:hypothetical protein